MPFCFAQVPFFESVEHELPAPQDGTPQQTPSVQKSNDPHALASAQSFPSPSMGTHALALQ